jgi:hypothetical protein
MHSTQVNSSFTRFSPEPRGMGISSFEFLAGYSLGGCAPQDPSTSPAGPHIAAKAVAAQYNSGERQKVS